MGPGLWELLVASFSYEDDGGPCPGNRFLDDHPALDNLFSWLVAIGIAAIIWLPIIVLLLINNI